jgi:heme/copper-type cytochrome/quinol oxidase subunit 2
VDTTAKAHALSALIAGAAEIGRGRLVLGIGVAALVLLVVLAVVVVAVLARRQRRRRRPAGAEPTISYATLAAPDAAPEPVTRGDAPLIEER